MSTSIPEQVVGSWQEFIKLAYMFDVAPPPQHRYVFRGQARADWSLIPSLIRDAKRLGLTPQELIRLEEVSVEEFEKQAHLYVPARLSFPEPGLVEKWQLMQHYGAPTRLLDWTLSPFIAGYFAVEKESEYPGVVWFMDARFVIGEMERRYEDYKTNMSAEEELRAFSEGNAEPRLYFVEPRFQTDRMGAQQTLFSVSRHVLGNHQEITEGVLPANDSKAICGKWVILPELKVDFMRRLRLMNITARALFPGIDGLGRSVAELIRLGVHSEAVRRSLGEWGRRK